MKRIALLVLFVLVLPACSDVFNPLEEDQEEAGITINVTKCEVQELSNNVIATAEITSEQPHDNVLLQGEVLGEDGTVLLQTSTSVQNLEPGKTYRTRLTFGSLDEDDAKQDIECDVQLDFAADIPG